MVSIRHSVVATGTNNSAKQVSVNAWNEAHSISGTANKFLGFDGAGELAETGATRGVATRAEMKALTDFATPVRLAGKSGGVFIAEAYADHSTPTDLDTQEGVFVRSTADTTKVWVRQDTVLNPYMFGAVGANVRDFDGSTDDSVALQAFFDAAWTVSVSHDYVFNFSGHWAVSQPLYFAHPISLTNHEQHGRRFIMGHIHVLPIAQQPGGVAMETVLTISSPYSTWLGHLFIHSNGRGQFAYTDKRFGYGLRCIQMQQSYVEQVTVVDGKKDAVWVDAQYENWTVRAGTPYETGSSSKNNIGVRFGSVLGVNCGSMATFGVTSNKSYNIAVTARDQGGDPGETGTFDTTEASFTSDNQQRTKLTVSTTAEMRAGEYGKMRQEIPASIYTSIAADNATSKLTWTAGDPVAQGLVVGQTFTLQDDSAIGSNDGTTFTIVGFAGTSNREITVSPKPTTEAATAYTQLNTEWSVHRIDKIISATEFMVHPWVPDQYNSKWYHISGAAAFVSGNDSACAHFDYVGSWMCGIGVNCTAMYGPSIDNFLVDYADIAVGHGISHATVSFALTIKHGHFEACAWDVVQCGANYDSLSIHANSVFGGNVINLGARATTSSPLVRPDNLYFTTLTTGGTQIQSRGAGLVDGIVTGNFDISNAPWGNTQFVSTSSNVACSVAFDELSARMGHCRGEIVWVGGTTVVPAGEMTFSLSSELTALGWTLVGGTTITAPGTAVRLEVIYNTTEKHAIIARFNAA